MKQDTRELILKESFKLFTEKRYEQVTVSDLERATKLTRGAIFYYMKNKEHLFVEVLDKYMLNRVAPQLSNGQMTLASYIDLFIDQLVKSKKQMSALGVKNMNFAFANITNQALYYYPEFAKLLKEKSDEERNNWVNILQQAVKSGEVVDTIDVEAIADLFQHVYTGFDTCGIMLDEGIALKETHRAIDSIYNLIKK